MLYFFNSFMKNFNKKLSSNTNLKTSRNPCN